MHRIAIGIDGGGSATRWAAWTESGQVAAGVLPPVLGYLSESAGQARWAEIVRTLATQRPPGEVIGALAGITGLEQGSVEAATGAAMLAAKLGTDAGRVWLTNDLAIAYPAVFRPGEGHLIYSGTGSVGIHVRADGTEIRVGGRGPLIDDGGSAFWIGRRALDVWWRRLDEGADPGALGRALAARIGAADWPRVRAFVYGGGRTAVAQLAQAVAEADDEDALAILRDAGRELARLASVLIQREGELPIALLGRAAGLHPTLLAAMRDGGLSVERLEPDIAASAARQAFARAISPPGSRTG